MTDIATLGIKIDSKGALIATKNLDKLERVSRKTEKATKGLTKETAAFGKKVGVVAGLLATALAVNTFNVNKEFQSLKATLITITGSVEDAQIAFDGLAKLSTETPFSIQQLTQAFIKLGALGLEPSRRAILSYGNTASAMGKDLSQMIEAVADATTGEFERLKEFGIKAKSEGDKVSLTFNGVTKTIGKNAAEIEGYLLGIGETKFAGAMTRQMETIQGEISNLGVAWDGFLDNLLDAEAESKIGKAFGFISTSISVLDQLITGKKNKSTLQLQLSLVTEDAKKLSAEIKSIPQGYERIGKLKELESLQDRIIEITLDLAEMKDASDFDRVASGLKADPQSKSIIKQTKDEIEQADAAAKAFNQTIADFNTQLALEEEDDSLFSEKIQNLTESLLTAEEAEESSHKRRVELIYEYGQKSLEAEMKASELLARERERHEESMAKIGEQSDRTVDKFEELKDAVNGWASSFADAMLNSSGSFQDFAKGIIEQMAKIALQQATQPLFSAFGDFLGDTFGGIFGGAESFDGGGFTGAGSRSGGVDGKGGFPAILHPNETVVDHTKGGGTSSVVVNVAVDASGSTVSGDDDGKALGRSIADSIKAVLIQEMRPNGILNQ